MAGFKEITDWYDQKHKIKGTNAWRPLSAYLVFLDYLNINTGGKLLDIGCGTGYLLNIAQRRGLSTFGVDISMEGIGIARRNSPESGLILSRGEDLPFKDGAFDYITCIGVLEHFLDINRGLNEIFRLSHSKTLLCVVVPNYNYFKWKFKKNKGTEQQEINENLMTLKHWKKIIEGQGFEILKIKHDYWISKNIKVFSSFNPVGIIKRILNKLLWIVLPISLTYQFIFLLKKPSIHNSID